MTTATVNDSEVDGTSPSEFLEYRVADWMWMYLAPAVLIVGVAGNAVSLVVLLGRSFRHSSLSFEATDTPTKTSAIRYEALDWLRLYHFYLLIVICDFIAQFAELYARCSGRNRLGRSLYSVAAAGVHEPQRRPA